MRRISISLPAVILAASVGSAAQAQTLKSTLVQSGFSTPLYVTSPPGDTHRLFVVEQAGRIRIVKDGALLGTDFINLDPLVNGGSGSERGLLGLAFHPNYATNGKFYVFYTDNGLNQNIFQYLVSGNPDVANAASATQIFGPWTDPEYNHNGGNLQFGPDGKLYCAMGDGGGGCDAHGGNGNGQNLGTYFGKFMRLDVDIAAPYVPVSGNPFPASTTPLIWSYGWRNPWRWSFDRQTGDLIVGDVGQNQVEEIDFEPAGTPGGRNYGWRCYEGNSLSSVSGCTVCAGPTGLTFPIQTYSHGSGCTVIGGYVYRGTAIPGLQGTYFYADYCLAKIWSFTYNGTSVSNFTDRTPQLNISQMSSISSFGQDANGELYIVDYGGGRVYRIDLVPPPCPTPTIYCTAAPNSVGSGAHMAFSGGGSIPLNNLVLGCTTAPANINGLFFYGDGQTQVPLGNGFRCVGSNLIRLPVIQTNFLGDANYVFNINNQTPGVIQPGVVKNFQFWYRDVDAGGFGYNASDALSVTFCAN